MSSRRDVESAHDEWDYTWAESQFDRPPMATSIPCQLRFDGEPEQDTDRFHEALDDAGFSFLDSDADSRHNPDTGPHYEGEVMIREKYHRIKVLVFRSDVVRLYPKDEYVPTVDELGRLIDALEAGFNATLTHDPIEGSSNDSFEGGSE